MESKKEEIANSEAIDEISDQNNQIIFTSFN